jgi:hypothetical protein
VHLLLQAIDQKDYLGALKDLGDAVSPEHTARLGARAANKLLGAGADALGLGGAYSSLKDGIKSSPVGKTRTRALAWVRVCRG